MRYFENRAVALECHASREAIESCFGIQLFLRGESQSLLMLPKKLLVQPSLTRKFLRGVMLNGLRQKDAQN